MRRRPVGSIVTVLATVWLGGSLLLLAGADPAYEISWITLDSGGGTSSNALFALQSTFGQTATAILTNQDYRMEAGYWTAAVETQPFVALPPLGIADARLGDPVTFTALATGTPPFHYQWRLNGVDLPGETNATLAIAQAQLEHGGAYSWVAVNALGVVRSGPAELQFDLPTQPFNNDHFTNRLSIELTNHTFKAGNVGATKEPEEPRHGGKLGGRSVWFAWSTNADGIATFRTHGSAFDTLLAVYTGQSVDRLSPVEADDDSGGFLTSEVRFNVSSGTAYQIAVDGLGGRQGGFVVSWEFEQTAQRLPLITQHPQSQAVRAGQTAIFTVNNGTTDPGFESQWYFRASPIPDATNATLTVSNASVDNLGLYSVAVTNTTTGRGVKSRRAALELGPKSTALSYSKAEDLLVNSGLLDANGGGGGGGDAALASASGFNSVTVGAGSIDSQTFRNADSMNLSRCGTCDVLGGAPMYYGLIPLDSGVMTLDTLGSTNGAAGSGLDTILIVYEYRNGDEFLTNIFYETECLYQIGCDDNGGSDNSSRLSFPVVAGRYYVAEVDGKNGATGDVTLTWQLSLALAPFTYVGADLYLTADTNLSLYPYVTNYSWLKDGALVQVTTEPRLLLDRSSRAAASYAVAMHVQNVSATAWSVERLTNSLGSILAASSRLGSNVSGTSFQLVLEGLGAAEFQVEMSSGSSPSNPAALWQWSPVTPASESIDGTLRVLNFPVDPTAQSFYRVRPKTP